MAAMRVNIPTVFVSGGPMEAGRTSDGRKISLSSVFEGVGAYQSGKINEEELNELEQFGCPTCGSCSGMFTANSMNCLAEALGIALPKWNDFGDITRAKRICEKVSKTTDGAH